MHYIKGLHCTYLSEHGRLRCSCASITGLDKQNFQRKIIIFPYQSVLTYVLGAQKNCLIETVLLSKHNICLG